MSKNPKRRALLIEAIFNRNEGHHLAELTELAFVAGYEVVDRVTQNVERSNPAFLFGKGKAKEIKGKIKSLKIDVVITENKLDSNQFANLRSMWRVEIIDRFSLILEIFIGRAGTQEALTQIRLAALKKEGGSRHESHRTVVSRNYVIRKLEKKLDVIRKSKDARRKRRLQSGFDLVAIAGYTNAGKSTLMNSLTKADVEVSGRMFTTLSTTTRSFEALGRKILVTDTIGLISRLPHVLIEAFYATLKEINQADLILFLIDANDSVENIKKKIVASINTLTAIEADAIPLLPVMNKIDIAQKIDEKEKIIKTFFKQEPIKISAMIDDNIDGLQQEILNILETYHFHLKLPNNGEGMSLLSKIHDKTRMMEETYHPKTVEIRFETNERLGRYLFNIILKSNIAFDFVNKDKLEAQLSKKSMKQQEDKFTVIKTETGEEFIVFDMVEDENQKKKMKSESSKELGLRTQIDEIDE